MRKIKFTLEVAIGRLQQQVCFRESGDNTFMLVTEFWRRRNGRNPAVRYLIEPDSRLSYFGFATD